MANNPMSGVPVEQLTGDAAYGVDTAGADTYTTIIAARALPYRYRNITAICATYDCIISLDGGTTDNLRIKAGSSPTPIPNVNITGAIQAKNATAGQNYAYLVINTW